MQSQQSLPKELRYAQYLACGYALIMFIQAGVYLSIRLDHLNVFVGTTAIVSVIYGLWWLFLGWQLGRLRSWSWVRVALLIFVALSIFISASQLVLGHFLAGVRVFYEIYYYGSISLALIINLLLLYYLTRPAIRDVFRSQYLMDLAAKNKWPSSPPVG